jgi:hypothetical protein
MPYKPLPLKTFLSYIRIVGWKLEKGGIDWNLYNDKDQFVCSIIIAHGKRTKEEVVAYSVHKVERVFKMKGLLWPPKKK